MKLVFLADIPWDALWQRPQHLATRFAARWQVLWVQPMTLAHGGPVRPVPVAENIRALAVPLFPLNARSRAIRATARPVSRIPAARSLLIAAQSAMLRSGLATMRDEGPVVVFMENFQLLHAAERLVPSLLAFDYIDNAFGFAEFPAYVLRTWQRAVRRADLVTVTAPELGRLVRAETPREVHLVPNAVEFARFAGEDGSTRPPDLPPPGRPVVCYIGSIYPWVDFTLIGALADAMPDAWVVLIGHAHPEVRDPLAALQARPNVRFLGLKPYREVPRYLAHADAGIIPFRRNELTASVNPVKLYEYSAAGVPTVASDFADDLRAFGDIVAVAGSPERFVAAVRTAVEQRRDPDRRRRLQEFARGNDWDARAATLVSLIDGALARRAR